MIDENLELSTESDVEQKVIMPLLTNERYLGIPKANVKTKQYLPPVDLDKAAGKMTGYFPDYSVWLHGLPVMIVEAKAPDSAAERGYREASLYARHLNQKYPPKVNPCACILAANGHTFLYGSWDAEPDLRLSLSDLHVGAAGLQSLQLRCSGRVLDQIAHDLSRLLRLRDISLPYDVLGGQAVLNAKKPLNTFAADLSPVLRRYFSSTPQENVHEIAERAYVSSDEVTEYDRVLESLLKESLALRRSDIVKPLEPTRHQEPNVAQAIASFDHDRPPTGQLQIVQGAVGVGKSLFARRYKDILQPPEISVRTRWAFIDFNTSTMADAASAERWVCQAFIDAFQAENPALDLYSGPVQRGIFQEIFRNDEAYTKN